MRENTRRIKVARKIKQYLFRKKEEYIYKTFSVMNQLMSRTEIRGNSRRKAHACEPCKTPINKMNF